MLVQYCKLKLSTQIEYTFFASIVSVCECFSPRNHCEFSSRNALQVLTSEIFLLSVIKCYLCWYKTPIFLSALGQLKKPHGDSSHEYTKKFQVFLAFA